MIVRYAHAGDALTGAREHQEDAFAFAFPDARALYFTSSGRVDGQGALLAVLADGMGGHVAGALASRTAAETFVAAYSAAREDGDSRLPRALQRANAAVATAAREPGRDGMGSTLLAVVFGDAGLSWVSVGDSPLFLFRAGRLYQLNEDHSLGALLDKLAADGEIDAAYAATHPRRHHLRSALTGGAIEHVDLNAGPVALESGDWVVLASDGVETVSHAAIADVLAAHAQGTPQALCRALTAAIAAAGNPYQDNATVLVVRPEFAEVAVG